MWMVFSDIVISVMNVIEANSSKIDDSGLRNFIMASLEEGFQCGRADATFEAMLDLRKRNVLLGNYASNDYWTSDSVIASAREELKEIEEKLIENIKKISTLRDEPQKMLINEGLRHCYHEGRRLRW
jgi:hypothetical protein